MKNPKINSFIVLIFSNSLVSFTKISMNLSIKFFNSFEFKYVLSALLNSLTSILKLVNFDPNISVK
ncbi:hypothetical protein [Mycoplasmopsis cynos]|uniref:hypothetical protein n=1 Tax=Mycoplasmopsis cynos TaxID=171284 RepID=UPI00220AED8A|nr:hypothetical protein [Mycoplasmopsis cynos]MCU9935578.1 hypothetical protein [Mycoplasmopsis cynos]UWV85859.1 hypothetical protein NW063_03165 [Mycoplasmopsis cynos]